LLFRLQDFIERRTPIFNEFERIFIKRLLLFLKFFKRSFSSSMSFNAAALSLFSEMSSRTRLACSAESAPSFSARFLISSISFSRSRIFSSKASSSLITPCVISLF